MHQAIADDLCVVIPSYNHAPYVAEAVESIFAQTVRPAEIRIIDDGSTDGTPAVLAKLAASRPDIHLHLRENRGAHATINEGIAATARRLVAILNSDDRYHPRRFEVLLPRIRAANAAGLIFSRIDYIDERSRPMETTRWYQVGLANARKSDFAWLSLLDRNIVVTTSNFVVRKSLVDALGGFRAYRYVLDLDLIARAILGGHGIDFVDSALCDYRIHGANTIREDRQGVLAEKALFIVRLLLEYRPSLSPNQQNALCALLTRGKMAPLFASFAAALTHVEHGYDCSRTPGEQWFAACVERAGEDKYARHARLPALRAALRSLLRRSSAGAEQPKRGRDARRE
jgi:glycosyltransferase involved in cell wall biosynthesis